MANSTGQFPINCQLCEVDITIKWKCLDCNLLLCEKCKQNFHLKFKNASQHRVINIKELGIFKHDEQLDLNKIECGEHQGQDCCLFCDSCYKSVCPICIAKIHNGHKLVELTKLNATVPQHTKKEVKSGITIVKEYKTSLLHVECIRLLWDNSLWMSCGQAEQLQNVKPEGNNLKIISELDILVADIAVTSSDKLLFVTKESPKLKQINSPKEAITDSCYSVAPLQPTCVHITRDNKVMVGARGGKQSFPATGRRVIIAMDTSGNHLTVYEKNRRNEPLFTYVKNICSTQNGSLCVVNHISSNENGYLLFLDQSGQVFNTYHGNNFNKGDTFSPSRVVSTPTDCVITSDIYSSELHILDNTGKLISYFSISDIGIIYPFSLEFNNEGQLYIGCSAENNGKLYLVDISEHYFKVV